MTAWVDMHSENADGRSLRPGEATAIASGGAAFGKVPEVTFGFWLIKVAATTLGETGGDAVTMSLNLGYFIGTLIFAAIFLVLVAAQVRTKRFHPFLFWAVIVATTTVGTTLADFADRSLGIGYVGGSLALFACLATTLGVWYLTLGSVAISTVATPKAETFYWTAILFSQTLGTALGDVLADDGGLGYGNGALVFGTLLVITIALYRTTSISRVLLFWIAFILTRPLGATAGDFLDKPLAQGGLALSRFSATAMLATFLIACIMVFPQRAECVPGSKRA